MNLNKICRFFFELAILLALSTIFLAFLHLKATKHFNITKNYSSSIVSFVTDDSVNIALGDLLPVYRFWEARESGKIGQVRVFEIRNNEITCSFDPKKFYWPMGRHGTVIDVSFPKLKVDVGSKLGFKDGDLLILFEGRNRKGRIQLTEVSGSYSWARVINSASRNLKGLTVSEYTFATQVAFSNNKFLFIFEILFFLFVIVNHCYFFIFRKFSFFELFGNWLKVQSRKVPQRFLSLIFNLVLCFPFVWLTVTFFTILISSLFLQLTILLNNLYGANITIIDLRPLVKENLISLYLSGGLIYFYVYYTRKKSPVLVFWDWVGFRSKEKAFVNSHFRDIMNWLLHLIIAYAFGRTLLIFLRNNLNFILSLAWPDPDVFITGSLDLLYPGRIIELIKSSFSVVVYVVTHPPHFKSLEIFFWVLRYLLFSLTIVGCIIGYGHSILGYLWGKKIRNLDFTIMGWLVNAICYTPLLGNIIWQMVPSYAGPDPIITDGPLYIFLMIVDFLLNLLYTLSIWNLGKMFGVMTDKGVRTNGFYSVVRHPSYTLEGLMFMTLMMNGFSTLTQWFAASMGIFIYYVRSERDDNFMSNSNPQYLSYKEKTPFKFLPGIY